MMDSDMALVVIDNLSAWCRTGRENEAESLHQQLLAHAELRSCKPGYANTATASRRWRVGGRDRPQGFYLASTLVFFACTSCLCLCPTYSPSVSR